MVGIFLDYDAFSLHWLLKILACQMVKMFLGSQGRKEHCIWWMICVWLYSDERLSGSFNLFRYIFISSDKTKPTWGTKGKRLSRICHREQILIWAYNYIHFVRWETFISYNPANKYKNLIRHTWYPFLKFIQLFFEENMDRKKYFFYLKPILCLLLYYF